MPRDINCTCECNSPIHCPVHKPRSIFIVARRWFDRHAGNTYFSASVLVDGVQSAHIPFEYGYGEQCLYEAFNALERAHPELVPDREHYPHGGAEQCWQWARRHGVEYSYSISDVGRKKDL